MMNDAKLYNFFQKKERKPKNLHSLPVFLLKKLQEIKFIIRYTQKEDAS